MSDATNPNELEQTEPTPTEGEQQETDWKAQARKWEERAKANREEMKALREKADQWDAYQSEGVKEFEEAKARAEKAEAELATLKAQSERSEAVAKAARAHGVDADLLSRMAGDVEENAAYLASLPKYRPVPDLGSVPGTSVVTRESIDAIQDPVERVRMRAQHMDLYK